MRYLIIDKYRAKELKVSDGKHLTDGTHIIISEKELLSVPSLGGDVEERAESEGLQLLSLDEVKRVIREGQYK